jgi:hypothetical protein
MDRIKSAVIITLDFFEIINGFEEKDKTHQSGGEEDDRKHIEVFARKTPNWMPDRPGRISCPSPLSVPLL